MSVDEIRSLSVFKVYYDLAEGGELDRGEIESIPLALELGGVFVSHDQDAIEIANEIKRGTGVLFLEFCSNLQEKGVFTKSDLSSVEAFLEKY